MLKTKVRPFLCLLLVSITFTLPCLSAEAAWWPATTTRASLLSTFIAAGVPAPALNRTFAFLDQAANQSIVVTRKNRSTGVVEKGDITVAAKYTAIIDYSLPSTEKRFYLLNLSTGEVQKFHVAHGHRSGVRYSTTFSNLSGSKRSSLGMVLTDEIYYGFHRKSMSLAGLEPSTEDVAKRDIVLHGADYASENFLNQYGRLGRSWGCTTVSKQVLPTVLAALKKGSVIYLYHPQLMGQAVRTPQLQRWRNSGIVDDPDVVLPGEEQDMQEKRAR